MTDRSANSPKQTRRRTVSVRRYKVNKDGTKTLVSEVTPRTTHREKELGYTDMKFLYTSEDGAPLQSKLQAFSERCSSLDPNVPKKTITPQRSHRVIIRHIKKSHHHTLNRNDSFKLSDDSDEKENSVNIRMPRQKVQKAEDETIQVSHSNEMQEPKSVSD